MGCKEALFTLGDRPEDRWPQAREWLEAHGYDDTLAYVRAMAIRVLEETGLLPHLNPGVMSWKELQRLKPVAPSMGMMLETTSRRLFETRGSAPRVPGQGPGGAAAGARGRRPARCRSPPGSSSASARRSRTGPSRCSRCARCAAVRRIQEVIVQNFRAKPDTAMRHADDRTWTNTLPRSRWPGSCWGRSEGAGATEPGRPAETGAAARRGRRLGRRVAADARSRQPRAPVALLDGSGEVTRGRVQAAGTADRPPVVCAHGRALARPAGRRHVAALADPDGLAARRAARGLPWQEPDAASQRGPHRPAHRGRHRGPHRGPPRRLRHRLRRLGRGARAGGVTGDGQRTQPDRRPRGARRATERGTRPARPVRRPGADPDAADGAELDAMCARRRPPPGGGRATRSPTW